MIVRTYTKQLISWTIAFCVPDYYNKKYGLIPVFKAGLNFGNVTVTEVRNIKCEIAYHGDVLRNG